MPKEQVSNKGYVGERRHLLPVIAKLRQHSSLVTKRFANVLAGYSEVETLGCVKAKVASFFGVKARSEIRLKKSYALHMDNSGHFTGKGFGRNAHRDLHPLNPEDIALIPKIVNSVSESDIFPQGIVRGAERFLLVKETANNTIIVVEVASMKDSVDLVTAYNITKTAFRKLKNR